MKKQLLAYTRQSKGSHHEHSQQSSQSQISEANRDSTIYNAIMGQMESNHSEYINKLLVKKEREEKDEKTPKHSQNRSANTHQRTKSYTNIIVENMVNNGQRNTIDEESETEPKISTAKEKKYIKTNIFFSHKNSPVTGKGESPKQTKKKQKTQKSFLNFLDDYIEVLTDRTPLHEDKKMERISQQRKTISKSKENNSAYFQILKKLQGSEKKIKDLKLNNHIIKLEETKQRKKNKQLKDKLHDMLDHMRSLTADLQRERYERKKMESFFKQFQQKLTMMYPQRKTLQNSSNFRSKHSKRPEDFFLEENTTEQEDQIDMILTRQMQISEGKSRSSRKNSGSKTYKYHKNIQNIQEFNDESSDSLFIPAKHFEDSDESELAYK